MLNLIQTQDSPAIIQIQVLKGFMGNERSLFLSWCLLYFNEYSIRRVREVTLGIIDWDMEQVRGQCWLYRIIGEHDVTWTSASNTNSI